METEERTPETGKKCQGNERPEAKDRKPRIKLNVHQIPLTKDHTAGTGKE